MDLPVLTLEQIAIDCGRLNEKSVWTEMYKDPKCMHQSKVSGNNPGSKSRKDIRQKWVTSQF